MNQYCIQYDAIKNKVFLTKDVKICSMKLYYVDDVIFKYSRKFK